jgi:hypothetical protein
MPCTVIATDKLQQRTGSANHEMRGNGHAANLFKVRVCVPVQSVGEEGFNFWATVLTGGQADGMQHDQIDVGTFGTLTEIGGVNAACR